MNNFRKFEKIAIRWIALSTSRTTVPKCQSSDFLLSDWLRARHVKVKKSDCSLEPNLRGHYYIKRPLYLKPISDQFVRS